MRRVLFVWLPAAVIVLASLLGTGWGAYWWWENQPEQLYAAAAAAYQQGESAREAGDPAVAMRAYLQAEERFVHYFRDGPKPPPADALVLRYKTLSHAASLISTQEAARQVAPGRSPALILGLARQCAAQAAADEPGNLEAQAAMLECCFREDQLDLADRYARNFLKALTEEQRNDPALHPHTMGAYYVSARAALRRTPPQAEEAREHLEASDKLQEKWVRAQYGDKPVAPSLRYRWRLTYLEAQALAVQATPPRLATGSRAANNARIAAQELQARIAVWLQRVRDEAKTADDESASGLGKLSTSDLRGLLDFMNFAVEHSGTRGAAVERVELMLSAWDALLVGRKPSKIVQRELVDRLGRVPKFLEALPSDVRPAPRDWAGVYPRWEAIAARLLEIGAEVEPGSYLELTRSAHKYGHYEQGIGVARSGIKAAETRQLPADNRDVLELHGEAAWMSLLRGKSADADEHLTALRRQTKHLRGLTTYVESLAALDDGQLDAGLAKMQQVRQLPEYTRSLYPHLGLARAHADAGRFDLALPSLERLEQSYTRYENLPEEQAILARRLGLHRAGVSRELFRAQLALGNGERAAGYKEQLREDPDWIGVSVLLVSHLLGLAPTSPRTGARSAEALDAAKAELSVARRFAPDDPRLLLLEAELVAARTGASSRDEADRFLRDALAGQENKPESHLVRVVWQLRRKRLDEASSALAALEKSASALEQDRLPALRARWQLASSAFVREADRVLGEVGVNRERSYADLHLAFADGRTLLSRSESAGLRHYRQALTDHAQGNLEHAARGYLRALPFGVFRPEARTYLLACLLQIRTQDSPTTANTLVVEMLQSRQDEPALLLAFIEMAVLLDNIHGSQGVEGATEGLETVLREQYDDPVRGAYYQARTWLAANRPDRAVRSVDRALQADPGHGPSLKVAIEAARSNRDWSACLRHAQALQKAEPGSFEGLAARAAAHAGLAEDAKALQAYKELFDRHPDRAESCLGPAALLEQSGNRSEALGWVRKRRERAPTDMTALRSEVRLLAKLGQLLEDDSALSAEHSGVDAALAVGRGMLEGGEPARALTWARRAETADKTATPEQLAKVHCLMGDACRALAEQSVSTDERKKHLAEAIEHYRTAYRDVPGLVEAGRPLALLLVGDGEAGANAAFAIVQRLRQGRYSQTPVSGDRVSLALLDALGVVYRATSHHREAVTLFREATFRYADEPVVYLHLGRALAALKRKPEAAEALDRATQLATARANRARDVSEKAHWLELADEAQQTR